MACNLVDVTIMSGSTGEGRVGSQCGFSYGESAQSRNYAT